MELEISSNQQAHPALYFMPKFISIILLGLLLAACRPATPANLNGNLSGGIATTTVEINTSNWKTYRNEGWRFEFHYPAAWVSSANGKSGIRFYGEDWQREQNFFKRDTIPPKLSISFDSGIDDLSGWILNRFKLEKKYSDVGSAVDSEIDLLAFNYEQVNERSIPYLLVAGEITMQYYFFHNTNANQVVTLAVNPTLLEKKGLLASVREN